MTPELEDLWDTLKDYKKKLKRYFDLYEPLPCLKDQTWEIIKLFQDFKGVFNTYPSLQFFEIMLSILENCYCHVDFWFPEDKLLIGSIEDTIYVIYYSTKIERHRRREKTQKKLEKNFSKKSAFQRYKISLLSDKMNDDVSEIIYNFLIKEQTKNNIGNPLYYDCF